MYTITMIARPIPWSRIVPMRTADAVASAIVGDDASATLATLAGQPPRDAERRLIAELIDGALREAALAPSNAKQAELRADAREWLRNGLALMSAKYCFEALGIDYAAAIAKLEAAWAAEEAVRR